MTRMRKKYLIIFISLLALLIFSACQKPREKVSKEDLQWQMQYVDFPSKLKIERDNIKKHIEELTSENYQGRKTASPGEAEASLYLASYLKDLEIPSYFEDSYFQRFYDPLSDLEGENVLGILKEEDCNKYIILSANYDHLGLEDRPDGRYYPGGNDNASGVAAVMEMARVLKDNFPILNYNVVFAFWSGHEQGLLGSQSYLDSLIEREKDNIVLLINMDTVGSFASRDFIIWYENEISAERALPFLEWRNMNIEFNNSGEEKSDHYYFGLENIPAITIRSAAWEAGTKSLNDNSYNVDLENVRRISQNLVSYIYNLKGYEH